MYLSLETIEVWEVKSSFSPSDFFHALHLICDEKDIMVIGSYEAEDRIRCWLGKNAIELAKEEVPFSDTFSLNQTQYPNGKWYPLNPRQSVIQQLELFCQEEQGGVDCQLFFDHVLIYRQGRPILPLLNFHDALRGTLYLSGHYSAECVRRFAGALRTEAALVPNPDRPVQKLASVVKR